jgi:hypothetical protein
MLKYKVLYLKVALVVHLQAILEVQTLTVRWLSTPLAGAKENSSSRHVIIITVYTCAYSLMVCV